MPGSPSTGDESKKHKNDAGFPRKTFRVSPPLFHCQLHGLRAPITASMKTSDVVTGLIDGLV